MSTPLDGASDQWERVASELRACRESQRRAWGTIDNATLGRYLAGEVSTQEREAVEADLAAHPELQALTELVRDVLSEVGPVVGQAGSLPPAASLPPSANLPEQAGSLPNGAILSLPAARKRRSRQTFRRLSLLAAACLLVGLGLSLFRPSGWAELSPSPRPFLTNAVAMREPGHGEWFATKDAPVSVAQLSRQGLELQKQGELDRAEPMLRTATLFYKQNLGPKHPTTLAAVNNLASVYQVALDRPEEGAAASKDWPTRLGSSPTGVHPQHPVRHPVGAPHGVPVVVAFSPDGRRCQNVLGARALRERLVRSSPEEVRRSVVPVLTQALEQSATQDDKASLARALGELGPAAREAVPALATCLRKARSPEERQTYLRALGQMGPAAREAVPDLLSLLEKGCAEDRLNACLALRDMGPAVRDLARADRALAKGRHNDPAVRKALEEMRGCAGRVGVNDEACCFSPCCLKEANQKLRRLARTENLEVLVESSADPAGWPKDGEDALCGMGPRAVRVLIVRDPIRVRVFVSEKLSKEGLAAGDLEKRLEATAKRSLDLSLESVVESLNPAEKGK